MGRLGDQSLTDIVTQAAQAQGVPVSLALAQAQRESGMNPNAVGMKGEVGLFQLMPQYFSGNGDLTDPTINANVALAYLAQQYQTTGNWRDALISYNEGPTAFSQGQRYASSQAYADAILASAGVAGGTTTPPAPAPVSQGPAPAPVSTPVTFNYPQPVAAGTTTTDWGTVALIAIGGVLAVNLLT